MASNSSNTTAVEYVGWQTAPHTRGTMGILLNCTSVILLITWTSFHPCIGISRKQRILTTITAIFVPVLPVLVASKDFMCAYRLWKPLHVMDGWKEEWTWTKSFLVVKGGICVRPHYQRSHIDDSSSSQSINSNFGDILDPDTFLQLARVGSVQYEDFPATMEIHDKSKADWFAKAITGLQLLWFIINIGCRRINNFPVSLMEAITLDWIVYGLLASILWLKCPQNIEIPYDVPVRDYRELAAESQSDYHPVLSEVLLRHWLTANPDYGRRSHTNKSMSQILCCTIMLPSSALMMVPLMTPYQFPSRLVTGAWVAFAAMSLSSILALTLEPLVRSDQYDGYIRERFVKLLMLEPSESCENETRSVSRWLELTAAMGFYDKSDVAYKQMNSDSVTRGFFLMVVMPSISVAWLSHFAKLVIALTAFADAPHGVYDVPSTWVLEALVHVGG
ncbi:hypothetical protein J7T55_000341 [Diaporthe amygdali]|uniref:uncharacterized protein n=1 Tax=Phomopsis amygdali TaxID=1214568 RepID=UPI0022FDF3D5|nr:uncharacterized protein J7T55_000341 [Diaporthe amygdali]KAJ0109416.1 hypothetical protein J7T55_000341 [Diaporthe amygdali]